MPVAHLHLGMHVLRADGSVGVVMGWKVVPGMKVMYNLEVAQDHTFVVGVGEWVVHNCDSVNPGLPTSFDGANRDSIDGVTGFANDEKLAEHFKDHGEDSPGLTQSQYEQKAIDFLNGSPDGDTLQLTRPNGDTVRWNTKTGEFGVVDQYGAVRTYYSISQKNFNGGYQYFIDQYYETD